MSAWLLISCSGLNCIWRYSYSETALIVGYGTLVKLLSEWVYFLQCTIKTTYDMWHFTCTHSTFCANCTFIQTEQPCISTLPTVYDSLRVVLIMSSLTEATLSPWLGINNQPGGVNWSQTTSHETYPSKSISNSPHKHRTHKLSVCVVWNFHFQCSLESRPTSLLTLPKT